MRTFIISLLWALLNHACASNLAAVQDEDLGEEQEILADNATDLAENQQAIDVQELDDEESLNDQQIEGENQQFGDQDQQFGDQDQQFGDQDQQFSDQDQQFGDQDQQFGDQDQQADNGQFDDPDTQLLNEGDEFAAADDEAVFATDNTSAAEGTYDVAAADAEGVPPPNEFSGAPPLPGTLKNLASGEAPAEYRIELGDTLYDICAQLLAEAAYWPKLWAMNDKIKNPHFVYPDFVLQFFPGDASRPPAIGIVGLEELAPEGNLASEELVAEETEKLFKDDDESDLELLNPEDIVVPPEVRELFRDFVAVVAEATLVQLPALILPEKIAAVGEIVGGKDEAHGIQDDRYGFVRGAELESGRVYTLLRYRGSVSNGLRHHGYRYDFIANIRVEDFTGDKGIAQAQVFSSVSLARVGDLVVEYRARSRKVPLTGTEGGNARGKIISFTHNGQRVGAMGDIAFLVGDVGNDFSKDQVLKIFKSGAFRGGLLQAKYDAAQEIGALQIIDVTDDVAISYIVDSSQEIMLGDAASSS